jgi:RNA 2',3'-cyclic 3'-phosphodiesterase
MAFENGTEHGYPCVDDLDAADKSVRATDYLVSYKETVRLFTALDLPAEVLGKLSRLLEKLRPTARIQWSPVENLHVTTKFIGYWPDERLPEVIGVLQGLEWRPPIGVAIREVGFFPNARSPRVFWCGVEGDGLEALASATDRATASLGVPSEARAFSPHLTLARIKERLNLQPLRDAIAALPSLDFGSFPITSFFLYQSQPRRTGGSVYTKLAEFPFTQK